MHFGSLHEEETAGKAYDRILMKRFIRYLVPYRMQIAAALGLLPVLAVCRLAQPWLLKLAIDGHIVTGDLEGLPGLVLFFLVLILGESFLSYLEVLLLQQVGQNVMQDLRMELFRHLQRLPSSFFDRSPTGGLITRLTSDVEVLGELFAAGIVTIVGDVILLVGIVGIMLWMNLPLSLVTFSVLPVLVWIAFTFRRKMREAFRRVRAELATLNSTLAETLGGISIVQLFGREEQEQELFRRRNASYRDANLPVITWDASLFASVEMLSSIAVGLIIWYGGREILAGTLSFGALVAFIQYIEKFFSPIRDLSGKYSIMQGAMAALERIFHLLDEAPAPGGEERSDSAGPFPFRQICFRNVSFGYNDEMVLRDFSLDIGKGEKIALVGETGSGKTTLTRLLARLYDVGSGSITIDGVDIRQIPVKVLRSRIAVVLQDPYLFTGSVEYNICLGDEVARARVRDAARLVGADRFIEQLPSGYQEQVRERGGNFSAGERQLISFARAVAFDPEILVLDEATANVDSESERMIQEGLKGLMAGRTTLVVAHRLSTIQDADRIVVVHRGGKAEEGSHQELLRKQGLYYRLYQLQFRD